MDYTNIIVQKPWGYEYLCYRNKDIAIWFLHIEKDKKTSMHCHPNKNTGFVVLNGEVELSFLRNSINLNSLSKIHIFRSRFHSTKAISDNGAFIFEIETPEDKHDLVRLEDEYGRVGVDYEGEKFHTQKNAECVWIDEPVENPKSIRVQGCRVKHLAITNKNQLLHKKENELFVITSGGLITDKNQKIVWPGDVIDGKTLHRLVSSFDIEFPTSAISIVK